MNRFITAGVGLALIATPLVATTATASNAAGADHLARQAPGYNVSAKINKQVAIAKEDTVKIRGKVSPKAAGEKVVLQQRMEGKKTWGISGSVKIKNNGTYLLKDKPSAIGTRYYRVLKPGGGGVSKGVSNELELVVYGWQKLGYRSRGPATNVVVGGATIGTDYYGSSIVTETAGTAASIEYTLGKKCTRVRSSFALTDSSETGSTGQVALKVDGKLAFASGLVVGQLIEDQENDITNAFRISYELSGSATPKGLTAVASPEVLCTK